MTLVVGLGARRGVSAAELASAVDEALAGAGLGAGDVEVLATLDQRAGEAVRALAGAHGWELVAFSAADLAAQPVPHGSAAVAAAVGTPSVAEAAALAAAGPGAELLLPKRTFPAVTVAVACRLVPRAFLDMPRWWGGRDAGWLADLPRAVRARCARWGLRVDGPPAHGSNALVVPVRRDGRDFVLRLTPPADDVAAQVAALRFWDGRGTAELADADPGAGAMLLERLGPSLWESPVDEAVVVLGGMMRRLGVPAPAWAPSTGDIARKRAAQLETEWLRLGRPFDAALLGEALRVAEGLSTPAGDRAVDGDLHSGQVLRGHREEWLTVDPVLLRGDIEYDLGRVLWTRVDEMADVGACFEAAVRAAGVTRDRARDWVVFRAVDYWLWGLGRGLTEDPVRCERVVRALAG